jgi:hypothetical protein
MMHVILRHLSMRPIIGFMRKNVTRSDLSIKKESI